MTAAPVPARRRYTFAEYLAFEEAAEWKHEFHEGEILAMSGTSPEHALITANAIAALHRALAGKPCRVYSSDLKIGVKPGARVCYPDGSIVYGALEFDPADPKRHVVTNPRAIIEVLSPTTEGYDRGEKFRRYREIPSLAEYVLISQTSAVVETFFRQGDGNWLIAGTYTGLDARARLRTVEIEIGLADIYAGVTFPEPAPPPDPREREVL
ncbi:MAG TPA: Uma2 family endonuclease [Tepidisphaeraceae bacterium]|jgi:Uma2 family endonuclease